MARLARFWQAVDGPQASTNDAVWFDGMINRGNANNIYGTAGDDHLKGTAGNDHFHAEDGGTDVLRGGGGNDRFYFGGTFTSDDVAYGGGGSDTIAIKSGVRHVDLVLDPDKIRGVETFNLLNGADYAITLLDGFDDIKFVNRLGGGSLNLDASALHTGGVKAAGGYGRDVLVGGYGDDVLNGRPGADLLTGGEGSDTFLYRLSVDSQSVRPDAIMDFTGDDRIVLDIADHDIDYHIGSTAERVGDVIFSYDDAAGRNTLDVFLDGDDRPDLRLYLYGDEMQFAVDGRHTIVLG